MNEGGKLINMKITKAYCLQANDVIDIYQARRIFFGQSKDAFGERERLDFLCSDEKCRDLDIQPKITGANYTVSFEKEEKFKAPHYRVNSKYKHHEMCDWLIKEREELLVELALNEGSVEESKLPNRFKRVAKGKEHDIIDLFCLENLELDEENLIVSQDETTRNINIKPVRANSNSINQQGVKQFRIAPLKSSILHELVTCYLDLLPDERKRATLQIGKKGKKQSYYHYFHPIKYLESHSYLENIIFYGGVVVKQRYGTASNPKAYTLQFYDDIKIDNEITTSKNVKITLYLKANEIEELPYGGQYIEALNTVYENETTHYIKCFLYLPNNPRYKFAKEHSWKVDIILPSMSHIELIPVLKGTKEN